MGQSVEEAAIVAWLKQEGEEVKRGELLCELETDKAVTELESVAQGVLLRQVLPAGSEVKVGTIIAYVGQPGEAVPEAEGKENQKEQTDVKKTTSESSTPAKRISPI